MTLSNYMLPPAHADPALGDIVLRLQLCTTVARIIALVAVSGILVMGAVRCGQCLTSSSSVLLTHYTPGARTCPLIILTYHFPN